MSEQNKAVFRRIVEEVFNQGKLATADELGAEYVEHSPVPGQAPGIDGFKQMVVAREDNVALGCVYMPTACAEYRFRAPP